MEILHASLRGASCRWNAPEWLVTGSGADMAAYTSSLTAQAPFVRTAMQKQLSYKKAFTRVIKQAIATAVDFGRLPEEVVEVLDIQCEAPSIPYKSALDEGQANQIRHSCHFGCLHQNFAKTSPDPWLTFTQFPFAAVIIRLVWSRQGNGFDLPDNLHVRAIDPWWTSCAP